jgi:hypothetical protein
MTQRDRDRLVALKKARKGLTTQRQAAEEIGQSERHVRRLLKRLKGKGDGAFVHALRGCRSNRKLDEKDKQKALELLSRDVYRGFGSLAASLSYVEPRQVSSGYTIQFDNQTYQIACSDIRAGMRGSDVRVEIRLDASMAVRFGKRYLTVTACQPRPKVPKPKVTTARGRKPAAPRAKSQWMKNFHLTSPEKTALAAIDASSLVCGKAAIR